MSPSRFTPRSAEEWAGVLPKWLGMTGLAASFLFWMLTGRYEPAFLTAFGGLLLGGQALELRSKSTSLDEPRDK